MKIAFASDHAGFEMKEKLKYYLAEKGFEITDLGTNSSQSADYPDFGHALAEHISSNKAAFGISLCGSGNGINMTANKHPMIRSALCWNEKIAELARSHNNANICAIPARFVSLNEAERIVDVFLHSKFEGGRHEIRINKIPLK